MLALQSNLILRREMQSCCVQVLKWYIKEGRQMGVHVSPTLSVNGLIVDSSSSWQLDEYRELLDPLITQ